jgi:hypothetical protein
MNGKHIELFLVGGVPGGITTAEIAGWTGHVLSGPRAELADILKRSEAQRNGAYLLLGDNDDAIGGVECYIGRTENFTNRFRDHKAKKDFWDRVVLITAKDDAFNEGHWGYLEARLVDLARKAERVQLTNDQTPQERKLSEAQGSDMEAFLEHLQIVLPVLGVNAIRTRPTPISTSVVTQNASPIFTLEVRKLGVLASAQLNGDEFTVLAGSVVVGTWKGEGSADSTKRAYASYRARHEQLIADGSIRVDGRIGHVTRDLPFTSPSTAGAVALGRSCNGRTAWVASGETYGHWENRGLDEQ